MKELWKKNTINLKKEQKSSLNQRSNINKENFVLIKSTIILIIVSLHL